MNATDVVPFIFLPVFFGFVITIIALAQKQMRRVDVGGRAYSSAAEFVANVAPELGLWGTASGGAPGPVPAHFSGALRDGRQAQVSFSGNAGKAPSYEVHLAVAAGDTPSVVVTREDGLRRLLKLLGWKQEITVGERAFDDRYFLESADPRAEKAFASRELQAEIESAFVLTGVERLEIGGGSLVLTARADRVLVDAYGQLLARLSRIARHLERPALRVHVVGAERHDHARCGYCHEDVATDEPDLVACDRCSTVVHHACWEELRQCPVAGCAGHAPERPARAAA